MNHTNKNVTWEYKVLMESRSMHYWMKHKRVKLKGDWNSTYEEIPAVLEETKEDTMNRNGEW